MDNDTVLVSTMNDIPGYKIVAVYGEVFGLICRARNAFSDFGAGLRTVFSGEVAGYTQLLSDSRQQAIDRLRVAAGGKGGNAVLAIRRQVGEQRNRRHHEQSQPAALRCRIEKRGGGRRADGCVRAVSEQTPR